MSKKENFIIEKSLQKEKVFYVPRNINLANVIWQSCSKGTLIPVNNQTSKLLSVYIGNWIKYLFNYTIFIATMSWY